VVLRKSINGKVQCGASLQVYVYREKCHAWRLTFWATVTSNGAPYATGSLSCMSVTLVYCGQMVGWIKMPLGTEVGLGPGDSVLDGDPAPAHGKGHSTPPPFRPMSIVAKRSSISATAELL